MLWRRERRRKPLGKGDIGTGLKEEVRRHSRWRKEYRQRHRGEEQNLSFRASSRPLGRGGDVFILTAPRSRTRTGRVVPALPHRCCMALDSSRPFPEPQFPHFKAKAVSRRLLVSVAAGVVTSVRAALGGTDDGRQTPGQCGQFSQTVTLPRAPYFYSHLCILNLIQTPLPSSVGQTIEGPFIEKRKEKCAHGYTQTHLTPG